MNVMNGDGVAVTSLLATLAVRRTLERYFNLIDRREWIALGECFSVDAQATYRANGIAPTLEGRAAIIDRLKQVERFTASNHTFSNCDIDVRGSEADAVTGAVAHLVRPDGPHRRILIRGLRYVDRLLYTEGEWRIHRRSHEQLWQFEADAVTPRF